FGSSPSPLSSSGIGGGLGTSGGGGIPAGRLRRSSSRGGVAPRWGWGGVRPDPRVFSPAGGGASGSGGWVKKVTLGGGGLVLHGAAEEVVDVPLDEVPLQVICPHADPPGPPDLGIEPGEAQASLLALARRVPLDDLRVDEDVLLVRLLRVGREIQDEEPE